VVEHEFDLTVGDVFRIGNRVFTVIDIDGDEVNFQIEKVPADELLTTASDTPPSRHPPSLPR
jgi:hypothetical protein